jgi:ribonuclease H2 subunit B
MILPESIADNSQLNFISYPDPHSGHLKQYILSDDERNIYELNQTNEKYRGWFIDDTIQSDGSLYVCTPIDPLFLVLSAICNAKQSKVTITSSPL